MRLYALALITLALPAPAQNSNVLRQTTFEDRPGVILGNDKLELTILTTGGALANLVRRDDAEKLSPYWNPVRMAREAGEKPGFGAAMGHFVCVDGFGPVSAEEQAAGLPGHGEAHTVPWEVRSSAKTGKVSAVTFRAELPLLQESFSRTFRMVDGESVIYVESELESHLGFDHPVCWAEHATIGSPYLSPEVTVVDMSGQRGKTLLPSVPAGCAAAPRLLPGFPVADGAPHRGRHRQSALHARSSQFARSHHLPDGPRAQAGVGDGDQHGQKKLVLGYVFNREEYPWLQDWEFFPASLKMARGMEFSTQPFDVPRREAIQTNSLFGAPTYRWLPAKSKIGSRFLLFYAKTPDGFRKVDDVRLEGGKLIVEDREDGTQIVMEASLPL